MFYVTIGDLERAIYDLANHFGEEFTGLTNGECIIELQKLCPHLHSDIELKKYAETLLDNIVETYGYKALRVTYSATHNIFGNELLSRKYSKLIQDVLNYTNNYREENNIKLALDVYRSIYFLREIYEGKYGEVNHDYCMNLYSLVNTIRLTNYNPQIIRLLKDELRWELSVSNLKYYYDKDYTDPTVLNEIYEYLAEELGESEVYQGHNLFYDYDGYGNTIYHFI